MNHIKPAFLLCVFCASTFVMSNCTQHQPIRGCSNGPLDERNFCDSFFPLQLAPRFDCTHVSLSP
ncbi:hypothetical protein Pst134EB_002133 [Puccinia striiformis f. sp. tritici]|nr:hypothetical protein Pst134EB_002133 [Puccinia striiformis f. sp. tritici]